MEQMTKIISKEKEMCLPTFEEPIRVEVKDANELSKVERIRLLRNRRSWTRKLRRLFRR